MSEDPKRPETQGSLSELIGEVLETVAEIGWSLLAAGRGVLAAAARLYRYAQGSDEPQQTFGERRASALEPQEGAAPPGSPIRDAGSTAALDADATAPGGPITQWPPRAEPTLTPPSTAQELETPPLPESYGVDRLLVAPRDPATLFAAWEVTEATRERAAATLVGDEASATGAREALRVSVLEPSSSDPADAREPHATWFVELPPLATSRYVDVPRSEQRFAVTLGLIAESRFVALLEPAIVETPASEACADATFRLRRIGDGGASVEVAPQALMDAAREALRELERTALPSSFDGAPGHRLSEMEVGAGGVPAGR